MTVKANSKRRLSSAIYTGHVWHRRFSPKSHAFRYRVFMLYLDLAELNQVFSLSAFWSKNKFALAHFKRSDFYGGNKLSISDSVRLKVEQELGFRPKGPIRLLTNIRYWGYIINPISCYYCFDSKDENLEAVLLEVTNTPWGERHAYVLDCDSSINNQKLLFNKTLHVSPFLPMDMQYEWQGSTPNDSLKFKLTNYRNNEKVFDAGVNFQRQTISNKSLNSLLWRFPLMTLQVFIGIHWQALKLWLKGIKIFKHQAHQGDG